MMVINALSQVRTTSVDVETADALSPPAPSRRQPSESHIFNLPVIWMVLYK